LILAKGFSSSLLQTSGQFPLFFCFKTKHEHEHDSVIAYGSVGGGINTKGFWPRQRDVDIAKVAMAEAEIILEQTRLNARNDLRIANNETKRLKHQAMAIAIAEANAEAEARAKIRKINLLTASMLFVAVAKKTIGNAMGEALTQHVLSEFGFSTTETKPIMSFISALINSGAGKGEISIQHRSLIHQYRSVGGTLPSGQFLKQVYAVLGPLLSRTLVGCCKTKTVYHLDLSLARDHIGNAYEPKARFPRNPLFIQHKETTLAQNVQLKATVEARAKAEALADKEAKAKAKKDKAKAKALAKAEAKKL
jgi:hypothetical protein